ncbi:efflux RND transporter permease subunit [Litoribrevibacter albus]|uniref:RND transporter n=1 Tax=Litoribrevibacter albus TaxID=1473156 RepID=A0AA37W7H6_9GAMM|nr:MMPL family transporter [Litoribrevibacter albus]GLQ30536.1 RND transporter [Litoribrevibacter albus]
MFDRYLSFIERNHRWVVLWTLIISVFIASGMTRLGLSSDFRIYFSDDNPQLKTFDALEEQFSKMDNLWMYLESEHASLFEPENLSLLEKLTEDAWQLPYVIRVSSLSNYQHTQVEGDELWVNFLVEDAESLSSADLEKIRAIAGSEPSLKNNVIGPTGQAALIQLRLALPDEGQGRIEAGQEHLAKTRALINEYRAQYPKIQFLLAGSVVSNVTMQEAVAQDLGSLAIVSYLMLLVVLWLLLRSVFGMIISLGVISLSSLGTMGFFGWIGTTLAPVAGFVLTAIMTLAIADSVHLLVSYFQQLGDGKPKQQAIRESLRINLGPVFITSLTTIIGVLCLNSSDSPPYQDLGNMIAVGVFMAWLLSMTLTPALLVWLPEPVNHSDESRQSVGIQQRWLLALAEQVIRRPLVWFLGFGVVVLLLCYSVSFNKLSESWHEYYDETFEVRKAVDRINETIGGNNLMEFSIETGVAEGIYEPDYMTKLAEFTDWLRLQPGVAHVYSLSDTVKRLNRDLNQGQASFYRIPESREMIAQQMLLYELSLPMGLGLEDTIDIDRSASRVGVTLKKMDSESIIAIEQNAGAWLRANAPELVEIEGTSYAVIFAHIVHRNVVSLVIGTMIAMLVICVVLMVSLKSIKLGLLSLIPNIAPAALAYGIWGMTEGYIDTAVAVVMCISLGVVVDDTVHFMSKYLRARREHGMSAPEAVRYAFRTVAVALLITTVTLVAGFSVMMFSHFTPSVATGTLMALTLALALVVDFLFLPALLLLFDKMSYYQLHTEHVSSDEVPEVLSNDDKPRDARSRPEINNKVVHDGSDKLYR